MREGTMIRRQPLSSLLVLVCVGLLSGCAGNGAPKAIHSSARSAPAPREIHLVRVRESFQALPCPRSKRQRSTTRGSEGCLEHKILRTDRAINRRQNVTFRLLRDLTAKRKFVL